MEQARLLCWLTLVTAPDHSHVSVFILLVALLRLSRCFREGERARMPFSEKASY